ncbi:MAG TPA: hypothetical protein VGI39_20590 [Polyangiaceae bacterium]|jgi:hypothetical protein
MTRLRFSGAFALLCFSSLTACSGSSSPTGTVAGGDSGVDAAPPADAGGPDVTAPSDAGLEAAPPADAAEASPPLDAADASDAADGGPFTAPTTPIDLAPQSAEVLGFTTDGYVAYATEVSQSIGEIDVVPLHGGPPQLVTARGYITTAIVAGDVVTAGNVVWTAATGAHPLDAASGNFTGLALVGDHVAIAYDDASGAHTAVLASRDLSSQVSLGPSTCNVLLKAVAGRVAVATCTATDAGTAGSLDAWDASGQKMHLLSSADAFSALDGDDPSATIYAASYSTVQSVPIAGGMPTGFYQHPYANVRQLSLLAGHQALVFSLYESSIYFSPTSAPNLTSPPNGPSFALNNGACQSPVEAVSPDGQWYVAGSCLTTVADGRSRISTAWDAGTASGPTTAYVTAAGFTSDSRYAYYFESPNLGGEYLGVYELATGTATLVSPALLMSTNAQTLYRTETTSDGRIVYVDVSAVLDGGPSDRGILTVLNPAAPAQRPTIDAATTSFLLDPARTGVAFSNAQGLHYVALP